MADKGNQDMAEFKNINLEAVCLFCILIQLGFLSLVAGDIPEYCSQDDFLPQCGNNEVIVMKHAVYGRMRLGKCIERNMGFLGCKTDVLKTLDEMCSNKQQCEVRVHSDLSKNNQIQSSCPSDLLKYLEADYDCEKVLQIDHTQCRSTGGKIEITTPISISSDTLEQRHCGSSSLHLTGREGQQLNITITDFNWDETHDTARSCINYLELKDVTSSQTTPVCAGTRRNRHILTTDGSGVVATFHIQDPRNQKFLIYFEAIGCGDITPPEGTWVQRNGDETTLGCHSGKHTWTLRCEHNQWVGAVGSCGTSVKRSGESIDIVVSQESSEWYSSIAPGMVVFAVCSVILLLASSIFTIGVCVYRKSSKSNLSKGTPGDAIYRQNQPLMMPHDHGVPYRAAQTMEWSTNPMPNRQPAVQTAMVPYNQLNSVGDKRVPTHYKCGKQKDILSPDDEKLYCNTTNSQTDSVYSDSVKYYVLENLNEQNR